MLRIKFEDKKAKLILFLIILLFLVLCFISFWIHGNETLLGSFEKMDNDDVKYLRSAWTLLATGEYTYNNPNMPTVFIMPGLTTVLAAFVRLFGTYPLLPFKIFQSLLGAMSLYILFLISRKFFTEKASLFSVFLAAIYFPNIYATNLILTEQIFSFLFILLVLITYHGVTEKRMIYYILGGITLGLLALFRPTILLFPIVVLALWIINKYKMKEMIKYALIVITITCAILSPWIIRNYWIFGEFIPLTLSSGNPFLQGTFINYNQQDAAASVPYYHALIREEGIIDIDSFGKSELVNNEVETWIGKYRIKNVMTKEPLKYIYWYTIGKTIKNWSLPFIWINLFNIGNYGGFIIAGLQHCLYIFLFIFAIITLRKNREVTSMHWLLLLSLLYFNVAHLPFYCFARYMYPVMPLLIIFSGYGVSELLAAINSKKNKALMEEDKGAVAYTS